MSAYATERLKTVDRAMSPLGARAGKAIAAVAGRAPRARAAPQRTLIVRPGGMGDLIAAHIAWEELGQDPRAPGLLWLVERRSAAWARYAHLPHLAYDDGLARAVRRVAGRFALAVNTEQRFGLSQAVAEAAVGPGGRSVALSTNLAATAAGRTVPYDPYDDHETVAFRRLFAHALEDAAGVDPRPRPRPRSAPSAGTRLVAIAGRQSPVRDLTLDQWHAHVTAWGTPDEPVTIAAGPLDAEFADALAARLGAGATRFRGSFDALCARIATAEEVLTMDGGPVHLASYLGTPTRALFTAGRERKWAPLAHGSTIVRRENLPGQPCTLFGQTPPDCPCAGRCRDLDPVRDVRPSPAAAASSSAR